MTATSWLTHGRIRALRGIVTELGLNNGVLTLVGTVDQRYQFTAGVTRDFDDLALGQLVAFTEDLPAMSRARRGDLPRAGRVQAVVEKAAGGGKS